MSSTEGNVITCKAAVVYEFNSPIKVEHVKVLPPTPGHVRIKMVATALCHSDLAAMDGTFPAQPMPYILGHEGAGVVESVGGGVTSVKKGDKVFTLFFAHCGECPPCLTKKSNRCYDYKRTVPPPAPFMRCTGLDGLVSFKTPDGEPIYHCFGSSSFSEYTVIPENSCVKVPSETNLFSGCIMACGFLTGYGSSSNAVSIKPGDNVAVWGMGGVGLACVVGCKEKNAGKIIGIDLNRDKEADAKKFGCTDYIALSELGNVTIKEKILQLTTFGLDFAFACAGVTQSMEDAISCLALGGTAVIVGLTKNFETVKFVPNQLLATKTIKGTSFGDYSIFEDIPKQVERYIQGKLPVDDFITEKYTLENINDAVGLMKQGKGIRKVVHF